MHFRVRALRGVSLFAWSARRAARRNAKEQAEYTIQAEERRKAQAQAEVQARLDATWQRLIANDPQTVLAVLEEAFEDNQAPAASVNCEGDVATIFMLYDSPDSVPGLKVALAPSGNPTLRGRTKTERNELYATVLASRLLVTAKEAFAVAPGINRVVALVMRKEELPAPARPVLSCLYCGRFERGRFERLDWTAVKPLEEISDTTPGALIERKWRTAEVAPLNLSDAPDLAAVLHTTADMLGCDANVYRRNANRTDSTRRIPSPPPPASDRVPSTLTSPSRN
jgi:hypothetical protein